MEEQRKVPEICAGCQHLDWDCKDEYSPIESFCLRNLIWPKKGTCKARLPWKKEEPSNG